jgi:hypothetical protein
MNLVMTSQTLPSLSCIQLLSPSQVRYVCILSFYFHIQLSFSPRGKNFETNFTYNAHSKLVNYWEKKVHALLAIGICSSNNIHEFEGEVQEKLTS